MDGLTERVSDLLTSRLLSSTWTDALLLLDEPGPASQFACETAIGVCGVGNGDPVQA